MRWQGRRESDNVEDRRGQSGSPFGGSGGGGLGHEHHADHGQNNADE